MKHLKGTCDNKSSFSYVNSHLSILTYPSKLINKSSNKSYSFQIHIIFYEIVFCMCASIQVILKFML